MCRAWVPHAEEGRAEVIGEVRGLASCPVECVLHGERLRFYFQAGKDHCNFSGSRVVGSDFHLKQISWLWGRKV